MRPVGPGVNEMRIRVAGEHRVLYVAKFAEAIYVLHAFTKKTQATSLHDVSIARQRYRDMIAQRGQK
jgi:phage-related protein